MSLGRRALAALALGTAALSLVTPGHALPPVADRPRVQAIVVDVALALGVDPALALALAHAESAFDPKARSVKGARGIMQIMPATVRGEYALHPDVLWDPRINATIGLHFLRRLVDYYGSEPLALSYYNGGSAVGSRAEAKIIPATRRYVDKVLRLRRQYAAELGRPDGLAGLLAQSGGAPAKPVRAGSPSLAL